MTYSLIDPLLRDWAHRHSLKLINSFAGREERFCYVSSSRGECFQISIDSPENDGVNVNAWSVETLDDKEMHQQWAVAIPQLEQALQAAFETVRGWMKRDIVER
jgi:hypothetical protein